MTNVILYCRVSSDEQVDGTSLDHQEKTLREYCRYKGYNIIKCCREDYSAKYHDFRRPEMKWILNYCKKHKNEVDLILFLRWDRFSRNPEFAHAFKRIFMDEMGINFNAIENPIDFEATEWSTLFSLYAGIAQTENNKISKRTSEGIREASLKGQCAFMAPRGYKNVRMGKHDCCVIIDKEKAPLVRAIFKEIAKGIKAPCMIRKELASHIPNTSFYTMLRNVFYIGKIRVRATKTEPEVIVNGLHEPLISEKTFYKVQEILDGKLKKKPKATKTTRSDLYPRKVLVCPHCGYGITGATSRGTGGYYTYYNCSHNPKHIRARAEKVNDGFAEYLHNLVPNEEILELYTEILKDINKESKAEKKLTINKLKEEIEKIKNKLNSVDDKFIEGDIDKEQYQRISDRYKREIGATEERIKTLELSNKENIEPKFDYSISLIANIDKYLKEAPPEVKLKIISSIFHEKIIFDGKNYRTKNYNKIIDLIYQNTNILQEGKNEKTGEEIIPIPSSTSVGNRTRI